MIADLLFSTNSNQILTASIMGPFFWARAAPAGLVQYLVSSRSARPSSEAILLRFAGRNSAETCTSVTFGTRSLRELTLMGIMYRQMNRGFVTKIIKGNTQVHLKLFDRDVPARMRQKHDGRPGWQMSMPSACRSRKRWRRKSPTPSTMSSSRRVLARRTQARYGPDYQPHAGLLPRHALTRQEFLSMGDLI